MRHLSMFRPPFFLIFIGRLLNKFALLDLVSRTANKTGKVWVVVWEINYTSPQIDLLDMRHSPRLAINDSWITVVCAWQRNDMKSLMNRLSRVGRLRISSLGGQVPPSRWLGMLHPMIKWCIQFRLYDGNGFCFLFIASDLFCHLLTSSGRPSPIERCLSYWVTRKNK